MTELTGPSGTIVLDNALDLTQVTKTGSTMHVNNDYNDLDFETNDFAIHKNDTEENILGEPIEISFRELAEEMIPVDKEGYVKKKIIEEGGEDKIHEGCIVTVKYSGYYESEQEPFDWTTVRKPLVWNMKEDGLLPGLRTALMSMGVGEISMFLLSYKVMYKMGCGPKYKPHSDCVYYIRLVRTILKPDIRTMLHQANMFDYVLHEAKSIFLSGIHFFKTSNYPMATRCFNRAVNLMHRCRLANEDEQQRQEKFLTKLYLNLAICYNHSKLPRRACSMCNEIHRLHNIWNNGKALYQNAKALRAIGEYNEAEKKLRRAIKLCPDNKDMKKEWEFVQTQKESYEKSNQYFKDIVRSQNKVSETFKEAMRNLLEQFKSDELTESMNLPKGMSDEEINYVQDLCQNYDFTCSLKKDNAVLDKVVENLPDESLFDEC